MEYKRSSSRLNIRDELLLSLLASDAVVDSREFEILSSEEVDDLKKEHQLLQSRLGAMQKKLALETKIRDAALSLARVNANNKKMSKQTEEQLAAASRRVEVAQKEWWRVSERSSEVNKRLLEHRAGVLSFSVRSMEKKANTQDNGSTHHNRDSGYETPNRSMSLSPVLSSTSSAPFDGAHLFAGHADTVVPVAQRSSDSAIRELEDKLKTATEALAAASRKQAEMTRDLSLVKLEKQEVETMMDFELQSAQDTIAALEAEIPKMEQLENEFDQLLDEKRVWEQERAARDGQIAQLQLKLQTMETTSVQTQASDAEIRRIQLDLEQERLAWQKERAQLEEENMDDLRRLQEETDRIKDEDDAALQKLSDELEDNVAMVQSLIQKHDIPMYSRETTPKALLSSLSLHLESLGSKAELESVKKELEEEVTKREALLREVEEARREREDARKESRMLTLKLKDQIDMAVRSPIVPTGMFPTEFTGDAAKIVSVLQPLWSLLPSPEARAAKFNAQRQFRAGSPTPSSPGGIGGSKSLSDLDVRSLKSLYGSSPSGTPLSPNPTPFTVEAFAGRVQALVLDDRSLIERLLRFAQAHDLLKKNADRAQKLAQEGSTALETYQKQVRTLEDRNMSLSAKYTAMEDQVRELQDSVDRITSEKLEIENLAAEQAETCRQLTEANNTLSARTLTLAEEAASAPEMIKKQLEAQLAESRAALKEAQERLEAIATSEQNQKAILLDELNTMQTENGQLRAQLRAIKK
ncbi:hypothetical protein BDZ89DRAFT_431752 [Hymenopellis radicata]|nr:hypothetical protein BDZ89DRAFT_431752 [Hymenopellis radicata]